jgi:hypothetical protein
MSFKIGISQQISHAIFVIVLGLESGNYVFWLKTEDKATGQSFFRMYKISMG